MSEVLDPYINDVVEWYIPGPIDVRAETLAAMAQPPYGHRTELIKPYIESIRRNLFQVVNASKDTHGMVLTGGSGTNALEMAARSWGSPWGSQYVNRLQAEPVLVPSIGYFGDLWADIFEDCGIGSDRMRIEEGGVIDTDELDERLSNGHYSIVAVTHNDTSTGTVNPLQEIASVVAKYPEVLFFVDGVSSVGGMPVDVTALGIDFLATAPQKGLGTPPGLSLAVVSNEALEKVQHANRGFTTDVVRQVDANRENMTLTTPPEAQIGALALQLGYIIEIEGVQNRYERHTDMANMARVWAWEQGFDLLPDRKNASDTVSCFVNSREIDLAKLQAALWENEPVHYGFDAGHPKLAKIRRATGLPDTFRVAHMGDREPEKLEKYLETISSLLRSMDLRQE